MSLTKRVYKGGAVILFFTLLTAPIGYVVRIMYSHVLSIQDYGLFYAVLSLLSIFNNYNDLGLGSSLVYFIPKFVKKKDYSSAWNAYKYSEITSTLVSVVLSFIFVLSAEWLSSHYFKIPQAKYLIVIFTVYHIADVFVSVACKFLSGMQKEKYYSSREFIRLLFTFILTVIFWGLGYSNVIHFSIAWTLAFVVTAVVFYYFVYNKHQSVISPLKWNQKLFIKLLKYGFPTTLTLLITTVISSSNTFFLTALKGVKDFGIYSIVFSIVSIPSIFIASVSGFFSPFTSDLMEGKKEKINILMENVLVYIPFFTFYFSLFIFMFPSSSIKLLFGVKWVEQATFPLSILIIGSFFSIMSDYYIAILLGIGLVKERLKISLITALLNVIISPILIYKLGIIGAVSGNVFIYLFTTLLLGRLLKRKIPFSYPWLFYFKLLLIAISMFVIKYLFKLNPTSWFQFVLFGLVYTVIILIFAYHLKLFNKKMVKLLINYCKNIFKKS
jgi:O-antigen/teichoic acid export membrane protein